MTSRVVVTEHARQRWLQRVAERLGLSDVDAIARTAWLRGLPDKRQRRSDGIRRIYMGYAFVFKQDDDGAVVLVTVVPPNHG